MQTYSNVKHVSYLLCSSSSVTDITPSASVNSVEKMGTTLPTSVVEIYYMTVNHMAPSLSGGGNFL